VNVSRHNNKTFIKLIIYKTATFSQLSYMTECFLLHNRFLLITNSYLKPLAKTNSHSSFLKNFASNICKCNIHTYIHTYILFNNIQQFWMPLGPHQWKHNDTKQIRSSKSTYSFQYAVPINILNINGNINDNTWFSLFK
jgi:hypothetical protein